LPRPFGARYDKGGCHCEEAPAQQGRRSNLHAAQGEGDCHAPSGLAMTRCGGVLMSGQYYVYIMTNKYNTVLYTGVTNNLKQRVYRHKEGTGSKFTNKYNLKKLVFYETSDDVNTAISREKQIKAGSRKNKIDLINQMNPDWNDLYDDL
jgi:putative endonuclease